MPARSVCLVTLSLPKLDPDASAARYPSQTSINHTIPPPFTEGCLDVLERDEPHVTKYLLACMRNGSDMTGEILRIVMSE